MQAVCQTVVPENGRQQHLFCRLLHCAGENPVFHQQFRNPCAVGVQKSEGWQFQCAVDGVAGVCIRLGTRNDKHAPSVFHIAPQLLQAAAPHFVGGVKYDQILLREPAVVHLLQPHGLVTDGRILRKERVQESVFIFIVQAEHRMPVAGAEREIIAVVKCDGMVGDFHIALLPFRRIRCETHFNKRLAFACDVRVCDRFLLSVQVQFYWQLLNRITAAVANLQVQFALLLAQKEWRFKPAAVNVNVVLAVRLQRNHPYLHTAVVRQEG